jgi:hypothetical protein
MMGLQTDERHRWVLRSPLVARSCFTTTLTCYLDLDLDHSPSLSDHSVWRSTYGTRISVFLLNLLHTGIYHNICFINSEIFAINANWSQNNSLLIANIALNISDDSGTLFPMKSNKVRWRSIMNRWTALTPEEKILALSILFRSGSDGWANVSPGELQETSGGLHYDTIKKGVARLKKLNALTTAPSDKPSKTLYRLSESTDVQKPRK